jgi:hypothetical protein
MASSHGSLCEVGNGSHNLENSRAVVSAGGHIEITDLYKAFDEDD